MKVWQVKHHIDKEIAMVAYKRFAGIDPTLFFDGKRLASTWKVPDVHWNPGQPGARVVDFPFFAYGALLCSHSAWCILEPNLVTEVEILPVEVEGLHYHLLNPLQIIDCLDEEQGQFLRYKTGRVTDIDHYVFDEAKLNGVYLFKTPELTRTSLYATQAFREIIEEHLLEGLEFRDLP